MNTAKPLSILAALLLMAGSCKNRQPVADQPEPAAPIVQAPASETSVAGIYTGHTGDQKNPGAQISLHLKPEGMYELKVTNSTEAKGTLIYTGKYSWSEKEATVALQDVEPIEVPEIYRLTEGKLISSGPKAQSLNQSAPIMLTKAGSELVNTYWKLINLMKQPVKMKEGDEREPHLVFHSEKNRLSGSTGCNTITGFFEQPTPNQIVIPTVGATKMACEDMSTERQFLKVLPMAESFSVQGDSLLFLRDKAGNEVAVFRAVALQ